MKTILIRGGGGGKGGQEKKKGFYERLFRYFGFQNGFDFLFLFNYLSLGVQICLKVNNVKSSMLA